MYSASHITYYHLCHRKLWLHHRGMRMEDNSSNVKHGILLGETTYQRRAKKWKELSLEGIKIDYFDPTTNTIREVKKSPKLEHVHVAQVQYYLYHLTKVGVKNPKGLIEYPKQRKTREVQWNDLANPSGETPEAEIEKWLEAIQEITNQEQCPTLVKKSYCKNCAFNDFCFS